MGVPLRKPRYKYFSPRYKYFSPIVTFLFKKKSCQQLAWKKFIGCTRNPAGRTSGQTCNWVFLLRSETSLCWKTAIFKCLLRREKYFFAWAFDFNKKCFVLGKQNSRISDIRPHRTSGIWFFFRISGQINTRAILNFKISSVHEKKLTFGDDPVPLLAHLLGCAQRPRVQEREHILSHVVQTLQHIYTQIWTSGTNYENTVIITKYLPF